MKIPRLALLGALLLWPFLALAQLPPRPVPVPAAPRHAWQISLFQIDRSGTLVGNPKEFTCTPTGCEQVVSLDIEGKPRDFLVALTFVPKGAYFNLQSMGEEVAKVVEFEKGFVGPLFLQVRQNQRFNATLRYTLAGSAMAEAQQSGPRLMQNERSLVFQRKMAPDVTLRIALAPAEKPEAEIKPVE